VAAWAAVVVTLGGLVFADLQLHALNDQGHLSADAAELQNYSQLNRQIHDQAQVNRFNAAAGHLLSALVSMRSPALGDELTISSAAAQDDHIAKLLLVDHDVLPHAAYLFAESMACVRIDYELIERLGERAVEGLHVVLLPSLSSFTRSTGCGSRATVNRTTVAFMN